MKKKVLAVCLIVGLFMALGMAAQLSAKVSDLKLYVNGVQLDKEIVSINGSSYLPVRAIGEAAGLEVKYDGVARRIDLNTPGQVVVKPETPAEPTVVKKVYKAGNYKIGTDLDAGTYKLTCSDSNGYLEVCKDSTGSFNSIVANENFTTFTYITVKNGQYFSFQGANAVIATAADPYKPVNGIYGDGMYKVGFDIPAGEYKIYVDEDSLMGTGYCEVSTGCGHTIGDIISNDNFEGSKYLTVKDGQYLTLTGAYIKK